MSMYRMIWKTGRSHRNTIFTPGQRLTLSLSTAKFSTRKDDKSRKESYRKPHSSAPLQENPYYSAFSFEELGASRTVKIIVIAALSILGTIESVFWVKTLWAKFSPTPDGEGREENDISVKD